MKRTAQPDSGAMSPVAEAYNGAPWGKPFLKYRKTSLPDLQLALQTACTSQLTQGCKRRSIPDFNSVHTKRRPPMKATAAPPLLLAPQDWQARVGWAGRFVKVPAAASENPAKPHHLGSGRSGKVVRMREVATGRDVAIKKFKSGTPGCANAARAAWREFEVTRGLMCRHANLPEEMAMDANAKAFLVFPFVSGITLARAPMLQEERARQVLIAMVTAVADLVAQGVAHNDIHGNNIMLCNDKTYLIDFGFACENDADVLWRQDMAMLEGTLSRFWPYHKSQEAGEFFRWLRVRVKAAHPIRIAEDALRHPYLSTRTPQLVDAGQAGGPGLRAATPTQTYTL